MAGWRALIRRYIVDLVRRLVRSTVGDVDMTGSVGKETQAVRRKWDGEQLTLGIS